MEFCPKCGTRLVPTQKGKRNLKILLACPKCGYEKSTKEKIVTAQRVVETVPKKQIAVIGREAQKFHTMPKTKAECPKCGNVEAYWWITQTRGSDESPTQFFRCVKCGYTWREYS